MFKKLEKLRQKPRNVRNRYALVGAVLVTSLVTSIWVISMPARFSELSNTSATNTKVPGGFVRAMSDIKGQFANISKGLERALSNPGTTDDAGAEKAKEKEAAERNDIVKMMFATSSEENNENLDNKSEEKPATTTEARQILIATSSNKKSDNVVQ